MTTVDSHGSSFELASNARMPPLIERSLGSSQNGIGASLSKDIIATEVLPIPKADNCDLVVSASPSDYSLLDDDLLDTAALDLAYPVLITINAALSLTPDVLDHVAPPAVILTAASSSAIAPACAVVSVDACYLTEGSSTYTAFRGSIELDNTPLVHIPITPTVSSPSLSYMEDDFARSMDSLAESLSAMSLGSPSNTDCAEYPRPVYRAMEDGEPAEKPKRRLVGLGILPEVNVPLGSVEPGVDVFDDALSNEGRSLKALQSNLQSSYITVLYRFYPCQ